MRIERGKRIERERIVKEAEAIIDIVNRDDRRAVGAISRYDLLCWAGSTLHELFENPDQYFQLKALLEGLFKKEEGE
jgi:hypothetical protein